MPIDLGCDPRDLEESGFVCSLSGMSVSPVIFLVVKVKVAEVHGSGRHLEAAQHEICALSCRWCWDVTQS